MSNVNFYAIKGETVKIATATEPKIPPKGVIYLDDYERQFQSFAKENADADCVIWIKDGLVFHSIKGINKSMAVIARWMAKMAVIDEDHDKYLIDDFYSNKGMQANVKHSMEGITRFHLNYYAKINTLTDDQKWYLELLTNML